MWYDGVIFTCQLAKVAKKKIPILFPWCDAVVSQTGYLSYAHGCQTMQTMARVDAHLSIGL